MKENLVEEIKKHGYWRVNFQPLKINRIENLQTCRELIEKSRVSLRGWDYPHVQRVSNASGATEACGEYFQSWTDWEDHKEFWRMYKSSQFLYYRAFQEDWLKNNSWMRTMEDLPPGTLLGFLGTVIYQTTEGFEFLYRLIQNGLYQDGVLVDFSLNNLKGRELWIEDGGRVPFSYPRKTGAENLKFIKTYTKEEVMQNSKLLANSIIREIFDSFEWNPSVEQILKDQDKLLAGLT